MQLHFPPQPPTPLPCVVQCGFRVQGYRPPARPVGFKASGLSIGFGVGSRVLGLSVPLSSLEGLGAPGFLGVQVLLYIDIVLEELLVLRYSEFKAPPAA